MDPNNNKKHLKKLHKNKQTNIQNDKPTIKQTKKTSTQKTYTHAYKYSLTYLQKNTKRKHTY